MESTNKIRLFGVDIFICDSDSKNVEDYRHKKKKKEKNRESKKKKKRDSKNVTYAKVDSCNKSQEDDKNLYLCLCLAQPEPVYNPMPLQSFSPISGLWVKFRHPFVVEHLRNPWALKPGGKRKRSKTDDVNVVEKKKRKARVTRSEEEKMAAWVEEGEEDICNHHKDKEQIPSVEEFPKLVEAVLEQNGTPEHVVFLYEKVLTESDLDRNENRLFVNKDKRLRLKRFLTKEERMRMTEAKNYVEVTGVDGKKKQTYNLRLAFWKSLEQTIIKTGWRKLVEENKEIAQKGNLVQIWGFRESSGKPGFAVNFKPIGDHHTQPPPPAADDQVKEKEGKGIEASAQVAMQS